MSLFRRLLNFNKRQKFVLSTLFLTILVFSANFVPGYLHLYLGVGLALLTIFLFYLILRQDMRGTFFYPLLILPFLYTLSFNYVYLLFPERLISMLLLTIVYIFGIYSLFLTQNIFAVSAAKTINLLRSARIVSFVITLLVLFLLIMFVFSTHLPYFSGTLIIAFFVFCLNFQSLWVYNQDRSQIREISVNSLLISLAIMELAIALVIWPVTAAVYSIFLIGLFYTYSGLSHAWFERRLFKGVLWEYIWVGFASFSILMIFSGIFKSF